MGIVAGAAAVCTTARAQFRLQRRRLRGPGLMPSSSPRVRGAGSPLRAAQLMGDATPLKPPDGFDTEKKIFKILKYPHPTLSAENAPVTDFGGRLRQLVENLFNTLYYTNDGIGLAAPQVGVNLRLMVYNPEAQSQWNIVRGLTETVFVNPRIVLASDEKDKATESCLSFPGMSGPVKRPTWVDVEAVDMDQRPIRRRIQGFEARLFQHEYDHLDGVVYVDRLGRKSRARVQPRLDELAEKYRASIGV